MKRIGEYTEEDATNWFEKQTPLGLGLKVVVAIVTLAIAVGAIGFVGGWWNEAVKVVSPANVKAQWQFAYDYDASLEQIATQWCSFKRVENEETNPDFKVQRVTQRLATETLYASVSATFNGRLADAFRGKIVAPPDIERTAEPLTAKTTRLCPNLTG